MCESHKCGQMRAVARGKKTRVEGAESNPADEGLLKTLIEEEVTPAPPPGFGFWPSFRCGSRPQRKGSTESIFASSFGRLFSWWGGSESNIKTKGEFSEFRIRTPRDNRVAAVLSAEKSKWISAFDGMTSKIPGREIVPSPVVTIPRSSGLFQQLRRGSDCAAHKGGLLFRERACAAA